MTDQLLRATAMDGKVRAFAVRTTQTVEELRMRHVLSPTATAALGRTISVGAMMGAMLKGNERLTLQIKGGGPIGQIVVDANALGEVRGYVDHPDVDPPLNDLGKMDVAAAVGTEGFIYVIKDLGLREPYRGSTPIVSGEIGDDFTFYFANSEQTPSAVAVGVLVEKDHSVLASGGLIIQVMPGMSDEEASELEFRLATMKPVSRQLEQGVTLEGLLTQVLEDVRILDQMPVRFQCKCSRDRVKQTLISLGQEELQSLIDEGQPAEIVCHFCNEPYEFDADQIRELIDTLNQ